MQMILPVTLTLAAVAALINIWLGFRVGQVRMAEKVALGDGGSTRVLARMRAHANFAEYTPFVLILIGAIEASGGNTLALWIIGAVYFAGRLAHAFGMDAATPGKPREFGILSTMLILAGLAGWAVFICWFTPVATTTVLPTG